MTKDEAKAKLRKAESDLRLVNAILERHEQYVQEIKDEIAKLEAIINKPDRWQDVLVQPDKEKYFFFINYSDEGFRTARGCVSNRKPEHAFKTEEQAELVKEKMLLMQEMHAFAHVRNEGWLPDWRSTSEEKFGIEYYAHDGFEVNGSVGCNFFIFGISVKSREIAEEMFEEFGERIENFYNKQY